MKKFIVTLFVLLFAAWLASLHPRVGLAFYDTAAVVEARLYGFQKAYVGIDEMQLAVYQRHPARASKTVVLLHGYTASKELWLRFANQLSDEYRIIIPDLAGHGETAFYSEWSYRASAQAERVRQLLDVLEVEQATLMGNSMGGMIAANFAIMYPQRIDKLVVFNPAGVTAPQPSETETMFAQGQSPFEIDSTQEFLQFYEMTMAKPPFAPEFVLRGMAQRYMERKAAYAKIAQDFRFHDLLDHRLHLIQAPTLIIWGDKDRILSPSAAPIWTQRIANSQLHWFRGIGHMPMVEIPAAAAVVVEDFL